MDGDALHLGDMYSDDSDSDADFGLSAKQDEADEEAAAAVSTASGAASGEATSVELRSKTGTRDRAAFADRPLLSIRETTCGTEQQAN